MVHKCTRDSPEQHSLSFESRVFPSPRSVAPPKLKNPIYLIILRGLYICDQAIGLMSRVFANGLRDQGSIPGRVIPKTLKMVLDAALLNSQHYKTRIKSKVE